jgi:hypothetical protein
MSLTPPTTLRGLPDLRMIIKAKAQMSQHRWKVTDADREAIVADLIHTGRRRKGIPILRPM